MPEIRNQSIGRDEYSVHFGPNVHVYDVSRTLAEAILASYYQNLTACKHAAAASDDLTAQLRAYATLLRGRYEVSLMR